MHTSDFQLGKLKIRKLVYCFSQAILELVRLAVGAPDASRVQIPAPAHTAGTHSYVRTHSLNFLQLENGINNKNSATELLRARS